MPKRKDRAIVEPVTVGTKTYGLGDEAELAKDAPQWNIDQMQQRGWLSGDWSGVGITPEEEAASIEKPASPSPSKSRR